MVEITALKQIRKIKPGEKRMVSRNIADILVKKGFAQIKDEPLPEAKDEPEPKKRGPKPKN